MNTVKASTICWLIFVYLFTNFGLKLQIKEIEHPSFIKGRVGAPVLNDHEVGVLGEIHPKVLEAWELENPAAAFELNLQRIIRMKQIKSPD